MISTPIRTTLRRLDAETGSLTVAAWLSLLVALVMFPTGILNSNEEYYLQLAAGVWTGQTGQKFGALMENSVHHWLNAVVLGLPVHWLGFEIGNAVLRIAVAVGLSGGLAYIMTAWRLSALDALVAVAYFLALDQQFFGGEWIFRSVEGKVLAYMFVFFGLGSLFRGKWKACVAAMVVATHFHFLVGGFWMAASLAWLRCDKERAAGIARAAVVYAIAVLPLVVAIAWQRASASPLDGVEDAWRIFAFDRNVHHIAPFSSLNLAWSWTPGIALLVGTLSGSLAALGLDPGMRTRRLLLALLTLQVYFVAALLVSATEIGVRLLGQFFLFRPSSLCLLLVLVAFLIVLRERSADRLPVWLSACVLIPIVAWNVAKLKIEEIVWDPIDENQVARMVAAADAAAGDGEIVLIQPGRDTQRPETTLPRLLSHPTLVNWKFVPTLPSRVQEWDRRMHFRDDLFEKGCGLELSYPIGALIVRDDAVVPDCGEVVWRGGAYSVVEVD